MTNKLLWPAPLLAGGALFLACQSSQPIPPAVELHAQVFEYKRCLRDTLCTEIRVSYPVAKSTDTATARRLSDSLQRLIADVITDAEESSESLARMTLQQRLEKIGPNLLQNLEADFGQDTSITNLSYSVEADYRLLYDAPQYLSLETSSSLMLGGAHGLFYTALKTFHKATGRSVEMKDITPDSKAFQALVEQAFLQALEASSMEPDEKKEMLSNMKKQPLPAPVNFCIVAEGVRILYNPYETPYGPADFVLTWEQLSKLTSADKWLK